jgi:formamidopyrimidine-DNA glycosylase
MPEGVEVKLSAENIRPLVVGKQVIKITPGEKSRYAIDPPEGLKEFLTSFQRTFASHPAQLGVDECTIVSIKTRGKFMYWEFSNSWYIFSTFGMSGQWSPSPGKHVCLDIRIDDFLSMQSQDIGQVTNIYFNDPRHFGTIKFVKGEDQLKNKLSELGWDPLQDDLTKYSSWLIGELSKTSKPIGQVLMDQSLFAGVGNYIRAEALYLAKMSPWKPANQLSKNDAEILFQACIDVMQTSYQYQGATIQTYKTAYGEEGRYSSCFKVYGKKTDPLGNKIIKEDTPDKRTIHWCPDVQK